MGVTDAAAATTEETKAEETTEAAAEAVAAEPGAAAEAEAVVEEKKEEEAAKEQSLYPKSCHQRQYINQQIVSKRWCFYRIFNLLNNTIHTSSDRIPSLRSSIMVNSLALLDKYII